MKAAQEGAAVDLQIQKNWYDIVTEGFKAWLAHASSFFKDLWNISHSLWGFIRYFSDAGAALIDTIEKNATLNQKFSEALSVYAQNASIWYGNPEGTTGGSYFQNATVTVMKTSDYGNVAQQWVSSILNLLKYAAKVYSEFSRNFPLT